MLLRAATPTIPPITLPTIGPTVVDECAEGVDAEGDENEGDAVGGDKEEVDQEEGNDLEGSDVESEEGDDFGDRCDDLGCRSEVAFLTADLVLTTDPLYRGTVLLNILSRVLSLKPPTGETVVASPDALSMFSGP